MAEAAREQRQEVGRMNPRTAACIAWSLCSLTVILLASGLLLLWAALGRVPDVFSPYLD